MATAITEAMTTIAEAEQQLQLSRTEADTFFPEWCVDLPELTEAEQLDLAAMRRRYLYQRSEGQLLEGTVTLLFTSPLLTIAGFYDPPFKVRAEETVRIELADGEEVLQGRLDVLVLKEQFWVVVLESKKTALSVWSALPQALAYLVANPQPERPSFGLVTNGDSSVFIKLVQGEVRQYDFSRVFAVLTSSRELNATLKILKHISQIIV